MSAKQPGRKRTGSWSGLTRLFSTVLVTGVTWIALASSLILGEAHTRAKAPPRPADVIVVLGAAAYGRNPSPVFRERLRHGVDLYHRGVASKLLFTGGKQLRSDLSEAKVGSLWAKAKGVDPRDILFEEESQSTAENLSFARDVMVDHDLHSAVVVSDPLHLARARLLAGNLGIDVQTSATPTTRFRSLKTKLPFLLRECGFFFSALLGVNRPQNPLL